MVASLTTKKHKPKTKKKFNRQVFERAKQQATAEALTEVMARFFTHWSRQQLDQLASAQEFVCIDLARDFYQVGKYSLEKRAENSWIVRDKYNEVLHNFYHRQAAVLWCLHETRGMFQKAREFLNNDKRYGFMQDQVIEFSAKLKQAMEKRDGFRQDLYLARLSWTYPMLEEIRNNLQKTITAAKYSKAFGEKKNETARTRN
jgi:hypothetical protein